MGSIGEPEIPYTDVLLVGAGFGSFTVLNKLRNLGLSVKIYEKGTAAGGVWYWNCYPGARVDSESPIYQLFDRELYEDFTFSEKYPSTYADLAHRSVGGMVPYVNFLHKSLENNYQGWNVAKGRA